MKKNKHLTREQIALYVDALKLNRVEWLDKKITAHTQECERCANEVFESYSILMPAKYDKNEQHPTLTKL